MPPLALTDDQFAAVFVAAAPLAINDRAAFFEDVAVALAAVPELGDGLIARTVRQCQRKYFRPPSTGREPTPLKTLALAP